MPTYHYPGIECGHEFDFRQSFADDPLSTCEECGGPVRRVISASPVVFKGTGWYITDSKPTADPVGGVQDKDKPKKSESDQATKSPDTNDKPAAGKPSETDSKTASTSAS